MPHTLKQQTVTKNLFNSCFMRCRDSGDMLKCNWSKMFCCFSCTWRICLVGTVLKIWIQIWKIV